MNEPLLSDYVGFLRRHRRVLIAALVAGLVTGVAMVVAERDTYTAQVSVLTPAVPMTVTLNSSGSPPEVVTMDTEAQLLRSGDVLRRLTDEVSHDTGDPRTLRDRISLTVPRHTRVLTIQFRAPTSEGAKAGAEVIADTFLDYRHELLTSRRDRDLEPLRERIAALQDQLESASGAGDDDDTTSSRRQTMIRQIEDLQGQLAAVEASAADPGQVLRAAESSPRPDETNDEVTVASSVGLSVLVGLALGLVRDRLPRRVRDVGDVMRRTGLPVLAEIGQDDRPGPSASRRARTAYRRLYNLLTQERTGSILVTANTTKLAMTVAAGLATSSAQTGKMTTLLLVSPGSAETTEVRSGLPPTVEVATVLPRDLQDERVVTRIVERLSDVNSQLLIVGPHATGADVLPLGAGTDATVLVAERGQTWDRDLGAGHRALELAGATVHGVVLVRHARQSALGRRKVHA